jgi:hypothetical protein
LAGGLKADETGGMKPPPDPHYRHRFSAEIISHAVLLYHMFGRSLRYVDSVVRRDLADRTGRPFHQRAENPPQSTAAVYAG